MKKFAQVFAFFFAVSFAAQSQPQALVTPAQLPVDSLTKRITYQGVLQATGIKADVLYNRAQSWFKNYYKNSKEVIRENDSMKLKISGKPRFKIYNLPDKQGTKTDAGIVQYSITVAAKDGRFKYELTEFNWKQPSYYASERWMDTKSLSYSSAYAEYLQQLDKYANELIKNLTDAIQHAKPVKDDDNW